MTLAIDRTDARILDALQKDGSLSAAQLAERCNLTTTTAWRRLQRLEEAGAIRGRVAVLDRKKLGLNVVVFVEIKLATTGRDSLAAFEKAIQKYPEVLDCYTIMGDKDFLLRIVVPSIEDYEAFFLDHLSRIPGVQAVTSRIALSTIKESTVLPLPTKAST
jgi:Lrp/AsnC family transcriptional regulator